MIADLMLFETDLRSWVCLVVKLYIVWRNIGIGFKQGTVQKSTTNCTVGNQAWVIHWDEDDQRVGFFIIGSVIGKNTK